MGHFFGIQFEGSPIACWGHQAFYDPQINFISPQIQIDTLAYVYIVQRNGEWVVIEIYRLLGLRSEQKQMQSRESKEFHLPGPAFSLPWSFLELLRNHFHKNSKTLQVPGLSVTLLDIWQVVDFFGG